MARRKKRRRKNTLGSKSMICMTTIAMLNIMAVSYGAWSEGSKINFKISTGNIDPCFTGIEISENKKTGIYYDIEETEDGQIISQTEHSYTIEDNLKSKIRKKNKVGKIKGKVIGEDEHTLYIHVENNGSIPIRLYDVENGSLDEQVEIEPHDEAFIKIDNVTIEPGNNNDDIILLFEQSI